MIKTAVGTEVGDMISFLISCPKLVRKTRIMTIFRLSCLCLDHGKLDWSEVKFWSSAGVADGPDLSEIIEPVQSCLLSSNHKYQIFTDVSSVSERTELHEGSAGTAIEPGYNPWTYVDFFDKDEVLQDFVKCYKEMRVPAAVAE